MVVISERETSLPGVRAPRQRRSHKTLERILSAVEKLLEDRPFEEITIAEIVRRARSSVGSFYARFPGKDALLPALYDRCTRGVGRTLFRRLLEPPPGSMTLAQLVTWGLDIIVDEFREHRWLFRAAGLYSRSHPEEIRDDQLQHHDAVRRRFLDLLLSRRDEIRHPDPERAVTFGLFAVAAACREKILFGSPHAATTRATDEELKSELSRMFLGYLNVSLDAETDQER